LKLNLHALNLRPTPATPKIQSPTNPAGTVLCTRKLYWSSFDTGVTIRSDDWAYCR
jgi:hypothetical protein